MSLSLSILIVSNLLLLFIIFASAYSSSCETKCGEMDISYPFGIGVGCYLDKWYEIQCVNNNTAFLSALGKEVANISFPGYSLFDHPRGYGSIRIKNAISSKGCSNHKEEDGDSVLNLTGSPFFVTNKNDLVAVGCNNTASLTNMEHFMVGCTSTCTTAHSLTTTIPYYYYYDAGAGLFKNGGICNGTGCCNTNIPDRFQQIIGVRIDDYSSTAAKRRECKVAFLTDEPTSLKYRYNYLKQIHAEGYSWVEIAWFIHTTNLSYLRSLGCQSVREYYQLGDRSRSRSCIYTTYSDSEYLSFSCPSRLTGNPFITNGCKANHINDCGNRCLVTHTCVNLPGGYKCVPKKTLSIVIGFSSGFGGLILIGGIYWLFKFIKRCKKNIRKRKFFKRNGGLVLQQQLISTESNVEKTRIFRSKELEKATENFSTNRMLGQGGQGTVYKGMLVDGGIVAIKKSVAIDEDKLDEFINEVVILSQINHRNIVKLLGCCLETEVPILVYEFIPNGNLFEHLHDDLEDSTITTWKVRLRIAVDIAGALSYLHSAASFPIFHRDIKSTNIMLDAKYRAKVSDFGTSRSVTLDHTHLTTVVSGTVGYLDPEYFQSSQFTDKSDVYSFGVVLVELITGAKPFSFLRSQENRTLAAYFIVAMKENELDEIIDARIKDDCKMEQVMAAAKLARSCLNRKGKKRPSMREVSMELERIRSSETDLEAQVCVVESDEEEQVHIEVESWNDVGVAAASTSSFEVAKTSFLDAQPLFPRQTW